MEQRRFGNYRVVRRLGKGGMASVYEAIHEPTGQRSAVKVLHQTFAQNQDVLGRFFNEAKAANVVEHPGIVHIHECGMTPSGVAYLAMEYLDGMSLHECLHQAGSKFPENVAVQLAIQLASALSQAHAKGIVHRDLKPENVMLVPDLVRPKEVRVKILDFGIAKLGMGFGMAGALPTRTGVLMGTPTYMAPEQCRGARGVDGRADVYALGVILYQMVSGAPPFSSLGAAEVMAQHVHDIPTPVQQRASHITDLLAMLVDQMLSKQPTARPAMDEVEKRLSALATQLPAPSPIIDGLLAVGSTGVSSQSLPPPPSTPVAPTQLASSSGGTNAVQVSAPDAPTRFDTSAAGAQILPPHAPTQLAVDDLADGKTKVIPALSSPTAETQFSPVSQDDPPTLRPEDAIDAAANLRRHAETKLLSINATLFTPPRNPAAFSTLQQAKMALTEAIQRPTARPLLISVVGCLLTLLLFLLLYALWG